MPSLPDFSSLAPYVHSVTDQPIIHHVIFQPPLAWATAGGAAVLGLVLGFASRRSGRKWRRRYEQESEFYAAYRHQADDTFRTQKARIAALEAELVGAKAPPVDAVAPAPAEPAPVDTTEPALVEQPASVIVETPPAEAPVLATEPVAPAPLAHAPEPVEATPIIREAETIEVAPAALEVAPAAVEPAHAPVEAVAATAPVAEVEAPTLAPVAIPAWAAPAMSQIAATAPAETPGDHAPIAPTIEVQPADKLSRLRGLDEGLAEKLHALGVTRYEDIEKLSAEDEIALEERLGVPAGFIAREQWRSQAALLRAGNEAEFNERYALVEA